MKLSLTNFIGEMPRVAPRLLPNQAAQKAEETKFLSGELRPFFEDTDILELDSDIISVYKWHISADKYSWILSNRKFFIEKSPVFNDKDSRIIINYPDTKETRITDASIAKLAVGDDGNYLPLTLSKDNTYSLRVPKITTATMSVNGTSTENVESRSYAVALVREWRDGKLDIGPLYSPVKTEEGNITIEVGTGQTVTISNITLPEDAYVDSGVRKIYIYRSTVGSDGTAMYGYVGEIEVEESTTVYTFTDERKAEEVEEAAVSLEWDEPLEMDGILSLSNGVFVGYNGYDIYFSYPYQVHAWPYTYRITVDYEIVGLGAFGNTVVVCTKGSPYLILVSDPASATLRSINGPYPCLSRDSIITISSGVLYASTDGLLLINSTSPSYFTSSIMTKDEWRDFFPENLSSAYYLDNYIGISNDKNEYSGFALNITNPNTGITLIKRNLISLYSDPQNNYLYFIIDTEGKRKLIQYDFPSNTSDQKYRSFTWKSKVFTSQQGISTLAIARVRADYYSVLSETLFKYEPGTRPINSVPLHYGLINSPINLNYVYAMLNRNRAILFKYYINGKTEFTKLVYDSNPFRLPSGFRGDEIEVEVVSKLPVHSIELASSMGELL